MKRFNLIPFVLFIAAFFSYSTTIVQAEEANTDSEGIALSVKANLPENQKNQELGYFDLEVQPGAKQTLSVTLKNSSTQDIETKVSVHTATTNITGSIDYSQPFDAEEKDTSLNYPMSELLIPEAESVTVPAGGETEVHLNLSVPAERFEGILLGAIRVSQVNSASQESDSDEGVVINNKYAYSLGVQLSEGETTIKNELALLGVEASQLTGRNTVLARLQHSSPAIVEKVSYEGKIFKKNSETILHEGKAENYRIAPNSTYEFPISWENQRFEAGEYILKLTVASEETGEKWDFEEAFTISRDEAKKLNEAAVDLGPDYTRWIIIGIIAFLGVIVIVLFLILFIQKQKQKRRKKGRKKKNGSKKNQSKTASKKRTPNPNRKSTAKINVTKNKKRTAPK